MATFHRRSRRPAVIIAIQSRQASRVSCRANHNAVPGWIMAITLVSVIPGRAKREPGIHIHGR